MTIKLKTIQKVLGFDDQKGMHCQSIMPGEKHIWTEHPQILFKPMGLIIWGASEHTFIDAMQCGNQSEAQVSSSSIPGRFFEVGKSFDDIKKLAELGELDLSLPQRSLLRMDTLEPGMTMRVHTSGPFSQFCVWGIAPNDYGPLPKEVTIEEETVDAATGKVKRFIGTIVQHSLDGPQELLVVHAPTSADCATILSARSSGRVY